MNGMNAVSSVGLSGINGGLLGPLQTLGATSASGGASINMRQLSELVAGFTSAEILMALMIAAASQKRCGKDDDGALALLAGMALASQLSGVGSLNGVGSPTDADGGVGQLLNITA